MLAVLSDEMSWGDEEAVDQCQETVSPAGSDVMLPTEQPHWLASRDGHPRPEVIVLGEAKPVPAVHAYIK